MSERGYLNGVPFRLNSKFYPQPRPQFKEIDIHIPVDALQDEYDFSLERGVLREIETWEEYKKEEEEYRRRQEEETSRQQEEERRREEEEEDRRLAEEERLAEEVKAKALLEESEADEVMRLAEELSKAAEQHRISPRISPTGPPLEQEEPVAIVPVVALAVNGCTTVLEDDPVPIVPCNESVVEEFLAKQEDKPIAEKLLEEEQRIREEKRKWLDERKRIAEEETKRLQEALRLQDEERKKAEDVNSFKKYYFPLLTSMATSRINQVYNSPIPSSVNPVLSSSSSSTPYMTPTPSPVNPYVLGSLTQPPTNHIWPGGTTTGPGLIPINPIVTYPTVVTNPIVNGPLPTHDAVRDANGSHLPASSSSKNSSQHSLL